MNTQNIKIIVASANPTKVNAALLGFQRLFPHQDFTAKGISVPSGVSDQPMNDEETFEGALNRAKNARKTSEDDAVFWVGIEGGLTYNIAGKMEAFAWIVVLSKENPSIIGKARTASFEIARPIEDLIHQGYELGHADDLVFEDDNSKQKSGATGLLTDNVMNRTLLYEMAMILALIPFKNKDLYSQKDASAYQTKGEKVIKKALLKIPIESNLYLAIRESRHAQEQFELIEENRLHLRERLPWLDFNKTVGDSLSNIEGAIKGYEVGKSLVLGIWFEEKLVGVISFNSISKLYKKATIGYWLSKDCQGKGIMTKACKVLIDYGFENLNLHRIEIRCAVGNTKSRAIPERLGFIQEGILKDAGWLYDHYVDSVVYGMVK
ncbi:MAG: GNAT family N-acetyltransferase [Chitinophagales bacterium]